MFGIDAVLLSYFSAPEIRAGDTVIDLCTGNGIIPLLLETISSASEFKALEIQKESADMAARSVSANKLDEKIKIIQGDIKNVSGLFPKHSFNIVTVNPPYIINNHGHKNITDAKTIARHEILCNLQDVIAAADYLLRPHGKVFMIHRPFRLPEIFSIMKLHNIEPKRMRLVQPSEGKEPNMVMIEGRKNANPELKIEPSLSVYRDKGIYSQEIEEIYNSFR